MPRFDTSVTKAGLDGQIAIVTGAGRGLGRTIAQGLAAAGATVAVVARSADQLAETASSIEAAGGRAISLTADVANQASVEQMVDEVIRRIGPIDILVNNAGTTTRAGTDLEPEPLFWQSDPEEWWRVWEVNLRGVMHCCRHVLPGMVARGRGRIINMSSQASIQVSGGATPYTGSKAALNIFTEGLANATRQHGISVFAISPGRVRTALSEKLWQTQNSGEMPWPPPSPVTDWSPPELVTRLVAFLASGKADSLTGRFIHARADDVGEMVRRAEEIQRDDLYVFRLRKLSIAR